MKELFNPISEYECICYCCTIQHFLWKVLWDLLHVKMVVFIQAAEKVAGQLAAAFIVAAVNTWKIKHSILLTGGSLEQVISACLFGVKIIWVKEHRWYWLINSPREQRMPSGAVLTSSLSRAWTCRKREQLQEQHCITFTEHGTGNNKTIQSCITIGRKESF